MAHDIRRQKPRTENPIQEDNSRQILGRSELNLVRGRRWPHPCYRPDSNHDGVLMSVERLGLTRRNISRTRGWGDSDLASATTTLLTVDRVEHGRILFRVVNPLEPGPARHLAVHPIQPRAGRIEALGVSSVQQKVTDSFVRLRLDIDMNSRCLRVKQLRVTEVLMSATLKGRGSSRLR